jgi:hypothetical protein
MPLTTKEKNLFTADQLSQIERLSVIRLDELLERRRAVLVARLASRTVEQLRCRVNILSVHWGSSPTVNYAPENDYTATEMQTITDGLKDGKWLMRIPELLAAGPSVEQRLTARGL